MNITSQPLAHCPVCRYDLTGLPKNHRCPECGFEYDETMQVWSMPAVPRWVLAVVAMLSGVFFLSWLSGPFVTGLGLNVRDTPVVILVLAGVVPFIGVFYPRGFVLAGRTGLTYRFPLCRARSLPWSQIRVSPTHQRVFRVRDGKEEFLLLPSVGLHWRRRRLLHAEIARLRREALSS
jgi:hypothetical protein